ncbi:MAG: rod shape-determining protein MreD [Gaiellaceae bacterium]|nr:rod shape-determining protein MreD [Gaiellaceae bacterium]
MSLGDGLRAAALLVAVALVQVVVVSSLVVAGGTADLVLVTVACLGLARGAIVGGVAGFVAGLVVDLATLDTLGLSSLVLTLAGYWAGRYAETSARGRRLPPLVAVGSLTVLAALFVTLLRALLGEEVVVERALATALAPTLVLNLALALPVAALVRALVPPRSAPPTAEVELVA